MAIELIDIKIFGKVAGALMGYTDRLNVSPDSHRMTSADIIEFLSRLRVFNILCFNRAKRINISPLHLVFDEEITNHQLIEWLLLIRNNISEDILKVVKPSLQGYIPTLSFLKRLIDDIKAIG